MTRVECVATQGLLTFISMPLLTELVSIKDGFSYKHGAPNGAVTTRQHEWSIRGRSTTGWIVGTGGRIFS
jgi:hypothetical protein